MNKQVIRLTYSDIQRIVESCARQVLNEEYDEGFLGGLRTVGKRLGNKMNKSADYAERSQGDDAQQKSGNVFNRMGDKLNKFGDSVTNAKKSYQVGSANQDAQKAIKNATAALKNLLNASERMKSAGGGGLQGQQLQAIVNAYQALTSGQGATTIGGGFQGSANDVAGGGKLGSGWKE